MADTTFTDYATKITAGWLQDINDLAYKAFTYGGTVIQVNKPIDSLYTQNAIGGSKGADAINAKYYYKDNIQIDVTSDALQYDATNLIIKKSIYSTNAVGGAKGADTINMKGYYLDGVLLNTTSNVISDNLTTMIHPDAKRGWQDFYKAGWYPWSFNQQWGGAGYGGLPNWSLGEVATGYIEGDGGVGTAIADNTARTYIAQGFKVSQNTDVTSVWIKVYKTGNPTNNLELYIYSDSAGSPSSVITNGTATAQDGRQHTDNTDGEWVKFTFPTAPSLAANTQYHIVCKSSGAVDASNYWRWISNDGAKTYPHGNGNLGNATPTWTPSTTLAHLFLIEPATSILQADTLLGDGKLAFFEGSPLNQSPALTGANTNFLNHKLGTFFVTGTGFTKDKTIMDAMLAIDNNRVVLRCNVTTGYAQVDLYESDGTKHTVTGTTDISTGNHVIGFAYRAEGDGSDYLKLYVDGASEGTPIGSATVTLDPSFMFNGHTSIGGGFRVAPTWTDEETMSALPSAGSWVFTGAATEANVFSVSGGILYQNGAGYASTDDGYYSLSTSLNNSTGWMFATRLKVKNHSNSTTDASIHIRINDGSKRLILNVAEYYIRETSNAVNAQHNFKELTDLVIIGQGSNYYIFVNGKLLIDGTGLLTTASAANTIEVGDYDVTASENADTEWHYLKIYAGAFFPEFTSVSLSEFGYWSADKTSLLSTIYNSGTIQSAKALAGIEQNYIKEVPLRIKIKGIVMNSTTISTTSVPVDDLSAFCFSDVFDVATICAVSQSSAGDWVKEKIIVNGRSGVELIFVGATGALSGSLSCTEQIQDYVGLNFVQLSARVSGGTATFIDAERNLTIRG